MNRIMSIKEGIVVLLVLVSVIGEDCRPDKEISDLWAGSASFSIQKTQNNTQSFAYNSYNISLSKAYTQNTNLQYAFAIKDIQVTTSNLSYFDLLVLKTYQSNIIINFIYQPNKWNLITYNYWISFRNDLWIGIQTYSIDHMEKKGEEYSIAHIIKKKSFQDQKKYVTLIYLNGIRFDFHHNSSAQTPNILSLKFNSHKLLNNQLKIHFQCFEGSHLKSITFTYIIYAPQEIQYVSYGGIINYEQFKGKTVNNLKYILPDQHFYYIYGISAIIANSGKENGFSLSSHLNNKYALNVAVKQWQMLALLQITYVIMAKTPATLCRDNLNCKLDEKKYIFQDFCVDECPNSQKMIKYIDGSHECQGCLLNSSYSKEVNKCLCNDGYSLSSNSSLCIKSQITAPLQAEVTKAIENKKVTLGQQSIAKMDDCFTLLKMEKNEKNVFLSLQAKAPLTQNLTNIKSNNFKLTFPTQNTKPNNYYCTIDNNSPTKYNCLLLFKTAVPSTPFQIKLQIRSNNSSICSSLYRFQGKEKS